MEKKNNLTQVFKNTIKYNHSHKKKKVSCVSGIGHILTPLVKRIHGLSCQTTPQLEKLLGKAA